MTDHAAGRIAAGPDADAASAAAPAETGGGVGAGAPGADVVAEATATMTLPGLLAPPYRATTLGIVALTAIVAFEALAVVTAMPAAATALDGLRWYAVAFAAALAGSVIGIVLAGRWSDARGPCGALLAALAGLAGGSVLAGLAPAMGALLAGRALQGIAIGAIGVTLYVLAARTYPARLHGRVFAAMATAWVVPSLVGPGLAGVIVETAGWRWVFLLVPLAVAPTLFALRPTLRTLDGEGPRAPAPAAPGRALVLALLTAAGLGGMHLATGLASPGARLAAGLPSVLVLAVAVPRLLPSGVLTLAPGLPSLVAVRALSAAAFFAGEAFVPLLLVQGAGVSTVIAGLTLTCGAVGWSVGAWLQSSSRLPLDETRALRLGGMLLVAGALVLVMAAALRGGSGQGVVAIVAGGWTVMGLAMGLQRPALGVLMIRRSAGAEIGRNAAALQLGDAIATAAALAVSGGLFATLLTSHPRSAFAGAFLMSLLLALASRRAVTRV